MTLKVSKLTESRRLLIEHIQEHKYIDPDQKKLIISQALHQFDNISRMIGMSELIIRRIQSKRFTYTSTSVEKK